MPCIRPISDLRNNFAAISKEIHENNEPVFLTKNGYGDMVVMSLDAFERISFENKIYFKLEEAELEAKVTNKRYNHNEVFDGLRKSIEKKLG